MKQVIILSALLLQVSVSAFAQNAYSEVSVGRPGANDLVNQQSVVNGETVTGHPYVYSDWLPGTLNLKDGRIYTNYQLRYDAYNQIVLFLSGTTSMELNDEIKDFSLKTPDGVMHFVNGDQYKKESKPVYYELIKEADKGALLRLNRAVIGSNTNSAVEASSQKKFNLEKIFYYYDKAKGKLIPLNKSKEKIKSALGLTDAQADQLNFNSTDFNFEKDLITFFSAYLKM